MVTENSKKIQKSTVTFLVVLHPTMMKMEQRQRLDRVNKLLVRTRSWVRACYVQQNYIHCTFRWCIQLNQRLTWIKKLVLECAMKSIELYGVLPFQTLECCDQSAPLPTRLSSLWFLECLFRYLLMLSN